MRSYRLLATVRSQPFGFAGVILGLLFASEGSSNAAETTRFGLQLDSKQAPVIKNWEEWTDTTAAAIGLTWDAATWESYSDDSRDSGIGSVLAALGEDAGNGRIVEISVPLFPIRADGEAADYRDLEDRWKEGSKGAFNEHFQQLAKMLIAHGAGDAHLRLAPHFNLDSDWSLWGIRDKPKRWAHFKACWKQVHAAMMSADGADFKWVWCVKLDGDQVEFDPFKTGWPGDAFVDVVSVTVLDESRSYYWQQYDAKETTHDWSTLRRWNWEEKAYGVVRDPYTGEVQPVTVPGLAGAYEFARSKDKRFAISEWAVVGGDRFPKDRIWGGNDNPLFIEAMSRWIADHAVDYALYGEAFSSSRESGNRDTSLLPNFWNQSGTDSGSVHPETVGNPLSSLQYLESIHRRLPEGYSGAGSEAPILAMETFDGEISSHWRLEGPWESRRGALHITNRPDPEGFTTAEMRTPSIDRQTMIFELMVANEGEGVYLHVGPWRLRISLLSDGRLGLVSLSDEEAADFVSTGLIRKPYIIGETYIPVKMEVSPAMVVVEVGDEQVINHPVASELEMSMDIKVSAAAGASLFLRSVRVLGGTEASGAE